MRKNKNNTQIIHRLQKNWEKYLKEEFFIQEQKITEYFGQHN
jgi:hypothetical protein